MQRKPWHEGWGPRKRLWGPQPPSKCDKTIPQSFFLGKIQERLLMLLLMHNTLQCNCAYILKAEKLAESTFHPQKNWQEKYVNCDDNFATNVSKS